MNSEISRARPTEYRAPFLSSLHVQVRVVGALLMREILTRYGRHNIGFLWLFLEPMLFTLGVTALWSTFKFVHSSFPVAAFAVTGYSSVLLWRNMPNRCIGAVSHNSHLLYHRNVKVQDIYISRILLEAMGATTSFVTLAIIFTAIGWMHPPEDLASVLLGWALLAWFGGSLAFVLGALSERLEIIDRTWHILTYLMFPLSGAGFSLNVINEETRRILLAFPMVHGVELVREGYFGAQFQAYYSISYLSGVCMILTLAGLFLTQRLGKTVCPE